jgi:hypothetical protein
MQKGGSVITVITSAGTNSHVSLQSNAKGSETCSLRAKSTVLNWRAQNTLL